MKIFKDKIIKIINLLITLKMTIYVAYVMKSQLVYKDLLIVVTLPAKDVGKNGYNNLQNAQCAERELEKSIWKTNDKFNKIECIYI